MKVYSLVGLVMLFCGLAFGQVQGVSDAEKMLSVPQSLLTSDQVAALEAQEVQRRLENYGKWVGVGYAANEIVSSMTDNTIRFLESEPGFLLMIYLGWHVMGKDAVAIPFGFLFFIAITSLFVWSYRKNATAHEVLVSKSPTDKKAFGVFTLYDKKYEVVNRNGIDKQTERALHYILYLVGILFTCLIFFL